MKLRLIRCGNRRAIQEKKILHFNARSIVHKWDYIVPEITLISPDVICITETWMTDKADVAFFHYEDFVAFSNIRPNYMGGGVLLLINPSLSPRASGATSDISISDSFNVVAAVIGSSQEPTTIVTIYRPPWASREDADNLIRLLECIVRVSYSFIILGDFNLPHIS